MKKGIYLKKSGDNIIVHITSKYRESGLFSVYICINWDVRARANLLVSPVVNEPLSSFGNPHLEKSLHPQAFYCCDI